MNFLDERLPARFWARVAPCPISGCWLWTGTTVRGGYARVQSGGKHKLAHRVAHEALVGPIPTGTEIDHRCRVRCCVNPAHLEPVTHRVNVLRSDGVAARRARQTHCKRGHELSGANLRTFERKPGHFMRTCRTCANSARRAA